LEVDANPDVEFYLKSTIYARAMRRLRQYKKKYGVDNVSLDTIYKQIKKRDDLDMLRTISPLKINKGTKVINNTCLKREETVKRMLSVVHARFPELVIN
jgi:cytidylate kinase